MLNFKILSEADDMEAISASVGENSKAGGDSKRSTTGTNHRVIEKDEYSYRLMHDVKSSINRIKRDRKSGGSTDSQSYDGAGGSSSHRSNHRK